MTTATSLLTDVRMFVGGCDLSWQQNSVELTPDREVKNVTTFRSGGWEELRGGLAQADVKAAGFTEFGGIGTVDYDAWARLGQVDALTIGPEEATAGNLAYLTKMLRAKYNTGGKVGEVNPWDMEGKSAWPLVRGMFTTGPSAAITGAGSSTPALLGACSATQRSYASLHVLGVAGTAGPTITVVVESDDNVNFTSATTVQTFTVASAVGSEVIRTVAGAITDTYYRFKWTVTGTNPSFLIAGAVGIF